MKGIIIFLLAVLSFTVAANTKTYCGKLYSIQIEHDIWDYTGMKLKDDSATRTIHDESAILKVIEIIEDSTIDKLTFYGYFYTEREERYFVCATGQINQNNTMKVVERIRVWESGVLLLDFNLK